MEVPAIVVRDEPSLLATYIATGAPFRFFPRETGRARTGCILGRQGRWHGHGVLMLQRPNEWHAIWVFWPDRSASSTAGTSTCSGPSGERRTATTRRTSSSTSGFPSAARGDGRTSELLAERVREGRFTADQVDEIRSLGRRIAAELDAGHRWWDETWAEWKPDPAWPTPLCPAGGWPSGHGRGQTLMPESRVTTSGRLERRLELLGLLAPAGSGSGTRPRRPRRRRRADPHGGDHPVDERLAVRVAPVVRPDEARTATPSTPPSSRIELFVPEALPSSSRRTAPRTTFATGAQNIAMPMPERMNGPTSPRTRPSARSPPRSMRARRPAETRPVPISLAPPIRSDSAPAIGATNIGISVHGRMRRPEPSGE